MLLRKLEESNNKVDSLQETILQLTAEKEALKSQAHLEGKISQYARAYYNDELCAFDQLKLKVESGALFLQLRAMLSQTDERNKASTEQEPTPAVHDHVNGQISVFSKDLDKITNENECAGGMEE
ncbi:hypothetical protein TcWFU_009861 [Taenia crassiceps]|uniref:Uncharacterized protein n=1 Tax=Taenia crassiceps TaxID=6207 RepID=A0ABR4QEL6_9CEST